ncbi:MAG: ankyrin repeat domain-containing protein [Alphaproteobacteria bacterium]|nr:ankyrin repeat domain-containing protein [Alphaproteobacteria bacterium]
MRKFNLTSLGATLALLFGDIALAESYDSNSKAVSTQKKEKTDADRWIEAAEKGDLSVLASLLKEKKVDVNCFVKFGGTALSKAISSKDIEDEKDRTKIVNFLLENGADPNLKTYSSPLEIAASYGREEIVEILLKHKAKVTGDALISASVGGNVNIVKSLVENGADVDYKEKYGGFPLMSATQKGNFNVVKYLVEHGAKLNEQSKYAGSPLMRAASSGYADIVKYLIEKGADVNAQDKFRYTALRNAVSSKISKKNTIQAKLQIINALLKAKADPTVIDSVGQTPLSLAQAQRRLAEDSESKSIWNDVIQKLKNAGAKE